MEDYTKYPQQIEDRIPEEWGKWVSVPESWYPVVNLLDEMIAFYAPDYVVHQVKEKFSGLRYYISYESIPDEHREKIDGFIRYAEGYSCLVRP